jgi:hypothetical protein
VIRLSDVGKKPCKPGSTLYIFATEAIQFDADLNVTGSEWTIYAFAPKWEVVQNGVLINLNGTRGADPQPSVAPGLGENGASGKPGGAAGNFFGLGMTISNSAKLRVHAVGGPGGDGQHGSPGKPNVVGSTPKIPENTEQYEFFSHYSCDLLISMSDINGYDLSPRGVYRLFGDDNGGSCYE